MKRNRDLYEQSNCSILAESSSSKSNQIGKILDTIKHVEKHPSFQAKLAVLTRKKEKQVYFAQKLRKLSVSNANDLFHYEIHEANQSYKESISDLKKQVITELLENADLTDRKSGEAHRFMRSNVLLDGEGEKGKEKNTKKYKFPGTSSSNLPPISSSMFRDDLGEILREAQAHTPLEVPRKIPNLKISEDFTSFYIEDACFRIGDLVEIYSNLSGESIIGLILMISDEDIVIRTCSGLRIKVLCFQIISGRVKVKHDKETAEYFNILSGLT